MFGSLLLLAGLGWGTVNVVELLAHEERTERFTVPAADISRLFVDNDTGSVTIVGTDADEISVEAEVSEGLRSTGFRHEVVDSTLELHGSCPTFGSMWCRVTYRIEVPRDLDVEVSSDNGRVESATSTVTSGSTPTTVRSSWPTSRARSPSTVTTAASSAAACRAPSPTSRPTTGASSCRSPRRPIASTPTGTTAVSRSSLPAVDSGYDVEADTPNGGETINVLDNPESPHTVRLQTDNGSITVLTDG